MSTVQTRQRMVYECDARSWELRRQLFWPVLAVLLATTVALSAWTYHNEKVQDRMEGRLQFWSAVLQESEVGMFAVRPDGTCLEWSSAMRELVGWGREEVVGYPITFLLPEEYRPQHTERWKDRSVVERLKTDTLRFNCWVHQKDSEELVHLALSIRTMTLDGQDCYVLIAEKAENLIELPPSRKPEPGPGPPAKSSPLDYTRSFEPNQLPTPTIPSHAKH